MNADSPKIPESHYRKLENMYLSAPCNIYYQPAVEISKAQAKIRIRLKPKFFHAAGAVHGSVYFKMIDDAGYFAANSLVEEVFLLTSNLNVFLIRPVQTGVLEAKAKVVSATKTQFISEVVLSDQVGRQVGRGTGLFVRGKTPLTAEIGYDETRHNLYEVYQEKFPSGAEIKRE